MVFNRETNKSYKKPHGIKAANNDWGTIDEDCLCQEGVIQKLHESHHFICSLPFEKKKTVSGAYWPVAAAEASGNQ